MWVSEGKRASGSRRGIHLAVKANPAALARHCVKRDESAESAYACTAAVWKFAKAARGRDAEWKWCVISEDATALQRFVL